jgi:hypothetical protein
MRWLWAVAVALTIGCASSQAPTDAGVDLSAGNCDPQQLFTQCSQQCGMPVCIVGAATCSGTSWVCDCSLTGPCRTTDLGGSD